MCNVLSVRCASMENRWTGSISHHCGSKIIRMISFHHRQTHRRCLETVKLTQSTAPPSSPTPTPARLSLSLVVCDYHHRVNVFVCRMYSTPTGAGRRETKRKRRTISKYIYLAVISFYYAIGSRIIAIKALCTSHSMPSSDTQTPHTYTGSAACFLISSNYEHCATGCSTSLPPLQTATEPMMMLL